MSALIIHNRRQLQGYSVFDCPGCGGKKKAYRYDNSPIGQCNRGSCGWRHNFRTEKNNKKLNPFLTIQKELDPPKNRTKTSKNALGKGCTANDSYLQGRILQHLPGVSVQDLLDKKVFGLSSAVKESRAKKWDKLNYRLFTPLYDVSNEQIITGQFRYTGLGDPPLNYKGEKMPKNLSMRGSYGPNGVTFGNLQKALRVAAKMKIPTIQVVEGDVDFIAMRAMGFDTCVGVPGASQAKRLMGFLYSSGWEGRVVLCLDQDDAGRAAAQEVISLSMCRDEIIVEDSSPGREGYDITDSLANFGFEFTARMVNKGRRVANISEAQRAMLENEKYANLYALKLIAKKVKLEDVHRRRIENTIEMTGGEKSPVNKLRRTSHCGEICEAQISYTDGDARIEKNIKKRCGTKNCTHCRSTHWNHAIGPYLLEHWPERLRVGLIPFENLEEFKHAKTDVLSVCRLPADLKMNMTEEQLETLGQSLHIHADIIKKHLVVAVNPEEIDAATRHALTICQEDISTADALKKYLLPAYMSPVEYMRQKVADPDCLFHADEFLCNKAKFFVSRKGLPWPKQEEIRDMVGEFFNELHEEEEKEKAESISMFVSYTERKGKLKILSISDRKFSFDGLSKSLMWSKKLSTNPDDPTINYLEDRDFYHGNLDNVIKDFVELHQRVPIEEANYEIHAPWAKDTSEKMRPKSYEKYCLELNALGYDPRKYKSLSFEHPLPQDE